MAADLNLGKGMLLKELKKVRSIFLREIAMV